MADTYVNEDLLDCEEEENTDQTEEATKNGADPKKEGAIKGNCVSIHSSGFRDFLLKPEVLRAIVDCGFEHPSQVQNECIPQAVLGMDVLCQAKSGMKRSYILYHLLTLTRPLRRKVRISADSSLIPQKKRHLFYIK